MYYEKQLKSMGLQSLQAASAQTFDLNTQKVSTIKEIQQKSRFVAWEVSQGSAGIFAPRASPFLPALAHKPLALNQLNRTKGLKMAILAHCSLCPHASHSRCQGALPGTRELRVTSAAPQTIRWHWRDGIFSHRSCPNLHF